MIKKCYDSFELGISCTLKKYSAVQSWGNEDIKTNLKFDIHAAAMVDMIDCAVAFLGPDLDPLEEQLITLGKRHVKYGVKPQYLLVMGQAVLFALQQILGSKFTLDDTRDWTTVFQLMSSKMALGMKA